MVDEEMPIDSNKQQRMVSFDGPSLVEHSATQLQQQPADTTPRRRFISRHRHTLDHIESDSNMNRTHIVPTSERFSIPNPNSSKQAEWHQKVTRKMRSNITDRTCDDWISTLIPAWIWMKHYNCKTTFPKDLIAGLTVGVMVVPQAMSYAKLAGLSVEYGLYSALVPIYACKREAEPVDGND